MSSLLLLVAMIALAGAALVGYVGWRRTESVDDLALWRWLMAPLGGPFRPATPEERNELATRLARAGRRRPDAVERFVEERAGAALLGVIFGIAFAFLVGGLAGFLFLVVLMVLGLFAPLRLVDGRAAERANAIDMALPSAVDLLVTCLDAGLSLEQALPRVTIELRNAPVLADELGVVSRELDAGMPLGEALRRAARRVASDDFASLTGLLAQASVLGTPLTQALTEHAIASRRTRMAFLEERAGRVATRLTLPLATLLLPAAILLILGPAIIQLVEAL